MVFASAVVRAVAAAGSKIPRGARIAIVGAAGRAGRMAALLLRKSARVEQLALYDELRSAAAVHAMAHALERDAPGRATVLAFAGEQELSEALKNSHVVLLMSMHDEDRLIPTEKLFQLNAPMVESVAATASTVAPTALLTVLAPPVNRTLPLAAEAMAAAAHPDPYRRVLGKAPAAEAAASVVAARAAALDPSAVSVPLVVGTCHRSVVPLLSAARPPHALHLSERAAEVVREKIRAECEGGSVALRSPLVEGWSAARLGEQLARARLGRERPLHTCALVRSQLLPGTPYFASFVQIGPRGVEGCLGLPRITADELDLLDASLIQLNEDVANARDYFRRHTMDAAARAASALVDRPFKQQPLPQLRPLM